MKFSVLRKSDPHVAAASAALAHWPRRDATLAQHLSCMPLPRSDLLFTVHAYRHGLCWNGFVDLEQWLERVAPGLASLARSETPEEHACRAQRLFEAGERPLQMPLPELFYDSLRLDRCVLSPQDAQRNWLTLTTPQGRVWLADFPTGRNTDSLPLSGKVMGLPLALEFRIGYSQIRRQLLTRLRCGDVLLVRREAFEVASAGKIIGRFSINEDGEIAVQEQSMNNDAAAGIAATTLSDIPLSLDFILQRRTMTVAQLDLLYRGQVLELDPQAERQVEISAHGVCLAKGELVELNGRLGVEVHELTDANRLMKAPVV